MPGVSKTCYCDLTMSTTEWGVKFNGMPKPGTAAAPGGWAMDNLHMSRVDQKLFAFSFPRDADFNP